MRRYKQVNFTDRKTIEELWKSGESGSAIAERLGRSRAAMYGEMLGGVSERTAANREAGNSGVGVRRERVTENGNGSGVCIYV